MEHEGMTGGAAGLAGVSGHATPSLTPVPGSLGDSSTISSLPVKPTREQQESRLLAYLMQNYDKQVRPLVNHNGNITVHVGITLTQIFDMVSLAGHLRYFGFGLDKLTLFLQLCTFCVD